MTAETTPEISQTITTDITPEIQTEAPVKKKSYKKEKSTDSKKHYVSNAQILEAFMEAKELGRLTDRLAKYLVLIAERYSFHPWFAGYSFRDDMVATAVVNLVNNWHKFDHTKSETPNPFSYYTTSVYRSFLGYINLERRERDIRDELLIEAGANPSFNYQSNHGSSDDIGGSSRDE